MSRTRGVARILAPETRLSYRYWLVAVLATRRDLRADQAERAVIWLTWGPTGDPYSTRRAWDDVVKQITTEGVLLVEGGRFKAGPQLDDAVARNPASTFDRAASMVDRVLGQPNGVAA